MVVVLIVLKFMFLKLQIRKNRLHYYLVKNESNWINGSCKIFCNKTDSVEERKYNPTCNDRGIQADEGCIDPSCVGMTAEQ